MIKRRRSRESALQVLYQWDVDRQDGKSKAHPFRQIGGLPRDDDAFSDRIVEGVIEHHEEIDRLIERYSENWRLDRIAPIDRTLLRIAIYELLYCEEIPPKVALNEAVDLGKEYGSEDSGSFINGILDRILNEIIVKRL